MNEAQKIEKEDVDWLNDTKKSRDIVREILNFGVTQNQIKLIISNLALELEDRQMMIGVRELIDPDTDNGDHQAKSIIYPGGDENE